MNCYSLHNKYYRQGGPAFFYDSGEVGVFGDHIPGNLGEPEVVLAPLELARKYGGMVIIWEHRFYEASLPFEVNQKTGHALEGEDAYKYLTSEQTLQDTVYLQLLLLNGKPNTPPIKPYQQFPRTLLRTDDTL